MRNELAHKSDEEVAVKIGEVVGLRNVAVMPRRSPISVQRIEARCLEMPAYRGSMPAGAAVTTDAAAADGPARAAGTDREIIGWRRCIIQNISGFLRLRSVSSFRIWEPGQAMRDVTHCGQRLTETNEAAVSLEKSRRRRARDARAGV
jgi:hypothetical protein